MLNQERIAKLKDIVAGQRDLMFAAERHIWKHPETGYREWETHKYLAEKYKELGYELVEAGNIPGFYTDVDTGRPGPKLWPLTLSATRKPALSTPAATTPSPPPCWASPPR